MESQKLSIVICTRNRLKLLDNLLRSIVNSQLLPSEVVIVSSGESILELVKEYSIGLRIKHLHTELIGQSNQKRLAFESLDRNSSWVFFLDDDLELMPNTLVNAYRRIELIQNEETSGIGTNLINKYSDSPFMQKAKFYSKKQLGRIKPSGRATKYAFNETTYTEWLNGVSIWRKNCLDQYVLPILNSRYAAYEDVIFSTNVSRTSKLIYDPEIKVLEQLSHSNAKLSISQFMYISLWTGYFVCSRIDSKIMNYKFLTILRAMKFLASGGILQIYKLRQFLAFSQFLIRVILLPMDKSNAKKILIDLLEIESSKF